MIRLRGARDPRILGAGVGARDPLTFAGRGVFEGVAEGATAEAVAVGVGVGVTEGSTHTISSCGGHRPVRGSHT